ncbi:hypothetical protein Y032_0016g3015 [Ancylostoma ceylanicum]|uniref:LIM zinc-binding domain-containing protein n=1 Tax=Ancylostoma ceylanicum TaxID=53326 RepID=A0A016V6K6_9BILA|nr:hypothetical protein Y032_0016g3015 [Ancylostoma ceylanicum]
MNTCGHCERKIEHEPALFARGRLWHVNHLLCNVCGCRIQEEEKFEEKEGIIACRHCYLYGNNPKCAGLRSRGALGQFSRISSILDSKSIPRLRQFEMNQNEPAIEEVRIAKMIRIDCHVDRLERCQTELIAGTLEDVPTMKLRCE